MMLVGAGCELPHLGSTGGGGLYQGELQWTALTRAACTSGLVASGEVGPEVQRERQLIRASLPHPTTT